MRLQIFTSLAPKKNPIFESTFSAHSKSLSEIPFKKSFPLQPAMKWKEDSLQAPRLSHGQGSRARQ